MPYLPGTDLADASGVPLLDSVAAILGESGLDFAELLQKLTTLNGLTLGIPQALNYEWLADRLAEIVGMTRLELATALTGLLASVPIVDDLINEATELGVLQKVVDVDTRTELMQLELLALITGGGGSIDDVLAAIAAVRGSGDPDLAAVLTAIGSLEQPSVPSSEANAEAVWSYHAGMRDSTGNMLAKLDEANTKLGPIAGYLYPGTSWFGYYNPTTFID